MTLILFDGVTYPSSFCRLLDFGRNIEMAKQANPFSNTLRYFWNPDANRENKNEQGIEKSF